MDGKKLENLLLSHYFKVEKDKYFKKRKFPLSLLVFPYFVSV